MNTADSGYFPLLPSSYLQSSSDANATQSAPVAGTSTESNTQSRFAGNKYAAAKKPQYDYWQESNERQRIHQRLKRRQLRLHARCFLPLGCDKYALEQLECQTAQSELGVHNPEASSSGEEEEEEENNENMIPYEMEEEEAEHIVEEEEEEEELLALATDIDEETADRQGVDDDTLFNPVDADTATTRASILSNPTPWLRRASNGAQLVVSLAARYAVSAITRRDTETAEPAEYESDGSSMEVDHD